MAIPATLPTRTQSPTSPAPGREVVSKVFDNDDFGYRKVTVERPLRLNFAATPQRISRLEHEKEFQRLAQSKKADPIQRNDAIAKGKAQQKTIRDLLHLIAEETEGRTFLKPTQFSAVLDSTAKNAKLRLNKKLRAAILSALGERAPVAEPCLDDEGNMQPDPDLRDTETVPLKESIDQYMAKEVLPLRARRLDRPKQNENRIRSTSQSPVLRLRATEATR